MDNEISTQAMERKEKPLNELLTSSMVSIYVGQGNTHWYIHERLLCYYSKFFSGIFYADNKNSAQTKAQKNKAYGLPEEEDLAFEMLVGWLYSRTITVPKEEKDVGPLLDLYLLSERVQTEKLSTELVEAISDFYYNTHTYPSLRRVQHIYAYTDDDNEMREMMVGAIAKLLTTSEKIPTHWASALQRNGQLALDIIRSIQQWKIEEQTIPDARDRSSSRGRSAKNSFSAVERSGTDSMETNKTNGTSNLGVESLPDHDHDMQESQVLKSEDSEAAENFTSPPPTYSTLISPEPSSSKFTTPLLEAPFSSPKQRPVNDGDSPPRPKKPPDSSASPSKSRLNDSTPPSSEHKYKKRRLSVTFSDEVQYSPTPSLDDDSGGDANGRSKTNTRSLNTISEFVFYPPPLATKPSTIPFNPRPIAPKSLPSATEGLGLKTLPIPMPMPMPMPIPVPAPAPVSELAPAPAPAPVPAAPSTLAATRPTKHHQRAQSDDEMVRTSSPPASSEISPALARQRAKMLEAALEKARPETVMLGFLWMLYFGWLAAL